MQIIPAGTMQPVNTHLDISNCVIKACAPVLQGGGAVDAQVAHGRVLFRPHAAPGQVLLQQVQQLRHRAEQQHAVACAGDGQVKIKTMRGGAGLYSAHALLCCR